ncbi:MAG: hypothetical protein Q4D85_12210 [Corynebacterium sp.]|uniref:hypothetical protein n=1 Tax=Corynebacterium sp. TaxID=1720 RepID=UPI0026DCA928|nr:hypothetical protein [Corynebacterium sp.]MDO5099497.1 hypothetical protein [Corynebacterium sp.]
MKIRLGNSVTNTWESACFALVIALILTPDFQVLGSFRIPLWAYVITFSVLFVVTLAAVKWVEGKPFRKLRLAAVVAVVAVCIWFVVAAAL